MRGLAVLVVLGAVCLPRYAASVQCPTLSDARLRTAFVEAERSPPNGRGGWERLHGRIGDYALYPYVELAGLKRKSPQAPTPEVEAFLARYDAQPVTLRIRTRWLRQLASRREWRKFIEWYPADAPIDLQCQYARALLATGDESGAFTEAQRLWMSGESRPKECEPVFAQWLKSDRFSPSLAWERTGLAMARGGTRLARYLERFLGRPDRKLSTAWRKIHANPRRAGTVKLDGDPARIDDVLVHGLERLARDDPGAAVDVLAQVEARYELSAAARAAAVRQIGLSFAFRHDSRAVDWLRRVDPEHADEHVLRWRVAAASLHARWDEVIDGIASMSDDERERERWRYWQARALDALGREDEARTVFESLARERDYYGFLAADRLQTEYRFNHRPLEVAPEVLERVAQMGGTRRALELLALGRKVDARREWRVLTRDLEEEELAAASWFAQCRDWHGRAILTIARTAQQDDLNLRFPIEFRGIVESASRRRSLSPATIFAFIRQESAFIPDARSGKGALGLMQILPSTGRMLMRTQGKRLRSRRQLLAPELNVDLGTQYIRSLMSKTGNRLILASASYNAGRHRVLGWLPDNGRVEADVWIDNIPFGETRRYVRRILAYRAVYEHRLGRQPTRLSEFMAPVPVRTDI